MRALPRIGEDCVSEYRVELDVFNGPLDLLLYLVRRDEIDVQDISVARIADQFLEYLRLLQSLDPNVAGEFLVMATTLVEIKSRALLPTPPLEPLDETDDPKAMLVRQLLEYKRFKDAARSLGHAADDRAKRFVRRPADLPQDLAGIELEDVQIWDLLSAFGRVMTAIGQGPGFREIRYDDTPIEQYSTAILERIDFEGITQFDQLFSAAAERTEIIGLFLALLELIRQRRVQARQERIAGTIYLLRLEEAEESAAADLAEALDDESRPLPVVDSSAGDIVEYASAEIAWVAPAADETNADDAESIVPGGEAHLRHAIAPHRAGDLEDGEGEYA
ncbi:MAG: segregation/condensation protein A [Phycisphaerales bacterium]|nr:segregation/condensation protein A [Phycisphaerales bacterium]